MQCAFSRNLIKLYSVSLGVSRRSSLRPWHLTAICPKTIRFAKLLSFECRGQFAITASQFLFVDTGPYYDKRELSGTSMNFQFLLLPRPDLPLLSFFFFVSILSATIVLSIFTFIVWFALVNTTMTLSCSVYAMTARILYGKQYIAINDSIFTNLTGF